MTDEPIVHEGTKRRSGRYPWGSGDNPQQRNQDFLKYVEDLKNKGLSDKEIMKGLDMKSTEYRERNAIAINEALKGRQTHAQILKETGMSNVAIGKEMGGINESSVRELLNPARVERAQILDNIKNMVTSAVEEKRFVEVGEGVENHLGVSKVLLATAVTKAEDEGYKKYWVKVEQGTNPGKFTTGKVLGAKDSTFNEIKDDYSKVHQVQAYSEDGGRTTKKIEVPKSLDSKRLMVRYGDDGGATKDGMIELRRGVDDISLHNSKYAQVRIAVDGSHYVKGMAMYSDKMPDGVDVIFNTNKNTKDVGTNKLDALKKINMKDGSIDADSPFGAIIRQRHYEDKNGKEQLSLLNIVGSKGDSGEEGGWATWSNKFSSQFLSKQTPRLAKQQLQLTLDKKRDDLDEIMSLTNPVIKKELLRTYADAQDSSSVHMQAVSLPRTANHVILPIDSLKDNEVFAPKYNNGERVVLVRHPHGGIFEIPELIVNNNNREAKSKIAQAKDAVGINSKVAERLSGADFDGDNVLVIPNNSIGPHSIQTSKQLPELVNFDHRALYKKYDGMEVMTSRNTQLEMGKISNLITDMTIKNANHAEIARAVKHSMVVIDAEKHELNYKQSAKDNNIAQLKAKYQAKTDGKKSGGAATLISRANAEIRVDQRKARLQGEGGPIDPLTGRKRYEYTGEGYTKYYKKGPNGEKIPLKNPKWIPKTQKSKRMLEVDDAMELLSDGAMPIEVVYGNHANALKTLANTARKEYLKTPPLKYEASAKKVYADEVASLKAKLNTARMNKPLERQAQYIADSMNKAIKQEQPLMSDAQYKKVKARNLATARDRIGAKKIPIKIEPREWEAIQSGAITNKFLEDIVKNTNLDDLKKLATPRDRPVMSPVKITRARNLMKAGYTQAEVSEMLGIPASTIDDAIK